MGEFISKEYLQKQFRNYSTAVNNAFEKKGAVTAEKLEYANAEEPEAITVKKALDILFKGGGSGSSTAEQVAYVNDEYPDLTNVDIAIDKILAKIYYEEPKIISFTMTPSTDTYEIGTVIPANTLEFSWAVNKEIKSQALTDCTIAADDRSATYGAELTNTKTFVLTVSDGEKTATASKKISFLNKGYWGSSAIPDEYNSEFILGLTNNKFISSNKGDYNFNVGVGEYGYFAVPSTMKFTTIWVNGFQADVEEVATVSFTNASGHTSTYTILKTSQSALGSFTAIVK